MNYSYLFILCLIPKLFELWQVLSSLLLLWLLSLSLGSNSKDHLSDSAGGTTHEQIKPYVNKIQYSPVSGKLRGNLIITLEFCVMMPTLGLHLIE